MSIKGSTEIQTQIVALFSVLTTMIYCIKVVWVFQKLTAGAEITLRNLSVMCSVFKLSEEQIFCLCKLKSFQSQTENIN